MPIAPPRTMALTSTPVLPSFRRGMPSEVTGVEAPGDVAGGVVWENAGARREAMPAATTVLMKSRRSISGSFGKTGGICQQDVRDALAAL